jgi:hypothetical protein
LSALTFFPADEIPGFFNKLKPHFPAKVGEVTE